MAEEQKASWFSEGYDNIPKAPPARTESDNRFWMKIGDSAVLSLVTDVPFGLYEHQVEANGRWDNYCTCVAGIRACPLCAAKVKRYYIGFFSAIHETEFKKRDGTTVKNPKVIVSAKSQMLEKFRIWKEKRGILISARFDITRIGDKSERIGDDWQVKDCVAPEEENGTARTREKMLEIAAIRLTKRYGESACIPHDWRKLLAPKTDDEMNALLAAMKTGEAVKTAVTTEEAVPF
jgi:hypothetical protein